MNKHTLNDLFADQQRRAAALTVFLMMTVACGEDGVAPPPPPMNGIPTASINASPTEVPRNDNNQTVVTLDGSGSTDPDNDPLIFFWTAVSGTFVNGTDANSEVAQATFPGLAPYAITLIVSDDNGGLDTAGTTITIPNMNPLAVVTAAPDSVPAGDNNTTVVILDGSGSSDPDGDLLMWSWTVPSGSFVNNTSDTDSIPEVTFPGNGDYTVTMSVTDGFGGIDSAQVTVFLK